MKTKYDKLTLTHNLYGVILPTDRYKHIYSEGAYLILRVIALYDDTINREATRTKVHQAKGKDESKQNDRALYKTADTVCKKNHNRSRRQYLVQGAGGPRHVLYERHGPQTP